MRPFSSATTAATSASSVPAAPRRSSRLRTATTALAALGAIGAGALLTGAAPAPRSNDATAASRVADEVMQRWGAVHMMNYGRKLTEAEALQLADDYDVLIAIKGQLKNYVPAMKRRNPDLKIFVYVNATYAQRNEGTKFPDAWYARDAQGRKITSNNFGNYFMDVTQQGWVRNRADECRNFLAESGYDACYLDMLGPAPVAKNYNSAIAIDPRTGKEWTRSALYKDGLKVAAAVKAVRPDLPIIANALVHGNRYFAKNGEGTQELMKGLDGGHFEIFMRDENQGLEKFRPEKQWKQEIDALVHVGEQGKMAITNTKMWHTNPTKAQVDRWHKYSLSSFLLGTDGNSLYNFSATKTLEDSADDHAWDRVEVGQVLGSYCKQDGAYIRFFSDGVSVVNPTAAGTRVQLDATLTTLDGRSVNELWLGPNTGEVLTGDVRVDGCTGKAAPADEQAPPEEAAPAPQPSAEPSPAPSDDPEAQSQPVQHQGEPVVTVTSPVRRTTVDQRTVVLAGDIAAADDVTSVRVAVRDNASKRWLQADGTFGRFTRLPATIVDGTSFRLTTELPNGNYGFNVLATDASGNRNRKLPWTPFDVAAAEATASRPVLEVTSPTRRAVVRGNAVTLTGTVDSAADVAWVRIAVKDTRSGKWLRNDQSFGNYQRRDAEVRNGTWEATVILPPGAYGFSVIAENVRGQEATSRPWTVFTMR